MISVVLVFTGGTLLVAGALMLTQGLIGRRSVTRELARQRISFPVRDALPISLARYAGLPVHTGSQARAFSELIGVHVAKATGGRTYAEIADEWQAGGRADDGLARLRDTAFMGQSLRGALLGAYQAWQVTLLVVGLGALFMAIGVAFVALALQMS
ncbi:hypothetical protein [Krasilnikovia sp. M28-CT-15]|uniref:hypothetical protein n=1 Tax=Krasilnikovia sp. M28-CT-15 TaxID=3373540 RepID=UPI003875EDE5